MKHNNLKEYLEFGDVRDSSVRDIWGTRRTRGAIIEDV